MQRRQDRIILYAERGKPLYVGFSPESQTQVSAEIQALFLAELGAIPTAKPLQRQTEQQFLGPAQNL
ncbi:hypothetical protein HP546_03660 [Pseudomonas sp. CM25]|uniref:hypothetical protein n=1 Tax=unclassified Pseudomonas TaxID=196821 RepID=UPI0015577567|nr:MULTISPECIES: hypothetical protein [unclassified Pseudomonas]NQD54449.1 hypothetical protein [Pseudomonas sp. CM25]NQD74627.1 hypothetical protein [Pseudomonas sp. CM27]HEN8798937.1 hypothetical protein [Pseudomonas putida]